MLKMSSVKRETSISVTDLHNVTDHVKRLAISVDGHPAQSPPSSSTSPHASTAQEYQQQTLFDAAPNERTKDTATNGVAISSILSQAKTNFFSKYELMQEIGRGGFSTVHQCQDKDSGAMYAVKVVDLRPLRLRERFNPARLRREVDIMRRLQHPNIIQFVDVYETTDQLMMVMEYCPGDELFDVILARKFFAETDAKIVFSQLCRALYYLHSLNIIHRDVKPGIFFSLISFSYLLLSFYHTPTCIAVMTSRILLSQLYITVDQSIHSHNPLSIHPLS